MSSLQTAELLHSGRCQHSSWICHTFLLNFESRSLATCAAGDSGSSQPFKDEISPVAIQNSPSHQKVLTCQFLLLWGKRTTSPGGIEVIISSSELPWHLLRFCCCSRTIEDEMGHLLQKLTASGELTKEGVNPLMNILEMSAILLGQGVATLCPAHQL